MSFLEEAEVPSHNTEAPSLQGEHAGQSGV